MEYNMNFVFDNNQPIYIQLLKQLKIYIISGHLSPGSRLPSVREFALIYKVNPNTMQKALIELEDLQLIYTERTNGKFVTTNTDLINQYREEYAKELSKTYIEQMKQIGFDTIDTLSYLNDITSN